MEKNNKMIITGAVIGVIIALAIWQMNQEDSEYGGGLVIEPIIEQQDRKENNAEVIAAAYEDGEYTSRGVYISPAGEEEIEVSLTIEDGTVIAAEFEGFATNPGSVKWQGEFGEGFEAAVVGKSIDELNLTVVNGSSLTPEGFKDALENIKEEARIEG